METINLLSDFIRMLSNQSCAKIMGWKLQSKFKNSLNKFSFVLLIVIWSQSASILTKAFTGLLLNTYFNQKLVPIVETLEDIYLNKEISIASDSQRFIGLSEKLDESNELKNGILTRMIEFEKKFEFCEPCLDQYIEFFLRKLIKGEIVFMIGSQKVRDFEIRWKNERRNFKVSSHKYNPNHANFLVAKINPMAQSINLM